MVVRRRPCSAKATLYNHFCTKDDVARALLAAQGEGWRAVVDGVAATTGLPAADAGLLARWLVGLVLQPGTATNRRNDARRLADVLSAGAGEPPADPAGPV
jgi:hypothetical protein